MSYWERMLLVWIVGVMIEEGMLIREKFIVFWYNYMFMVVILDVKFNFKYIDIF